jgi:hypothetical protein
MNTAFRITGIFVLLLTLCVPASGFAALPPFESNGGFQIEYLTPGGWKDAGFLSFDAFFREKHLNLPAGERPVTLRLTKSGEGPGHIDAALMNGRPPAQVKGVTDNQPHRKLAGKDFDVIHFPETGKSVEMTFPASGALMIAARVEGKRPHEAPFRFPADEANASFIRFAPSVNETCLFSTETLPGTGHPSAPTSAWASMEDGLLKVRVDFCPDNTLDGGKDYAAVHVKTPEGVKEFRISQDRTQWGQPDFTYTPEVPWQHKVYSFRIPASELKGMDLSSSMGLAVTAYGTAGPGPYAPSMVYGAQNREYMAAYHHYYADNNTQIRVQRYAPSGAPVGSPSNVTDKDGAYKSNATLAYNGNLNQYLVLWEEDEKGITQIARQLISNSGSLEGDIQRTAGLNHKYRACAAFSPTSNYYMTAWDENGDVYREMLFPDASSVDPGPVQITALASIQSHPDIAWTSRNNRFLLVWENRANAATTGTDISGIYIDPTGQSLSQEFYISTHTDLQTRPQVAYEPGADRALVVWVDYRNQEDGEDNRDVYGQFLYGHDPDGGELVITDAPEDLTLTRVFPAGNGRFLVIWSTANTSGNDRIQGRFVTVGGAMTPIRELTDASISVALGDLAGTNGPGMLMIYEVDSLTGTDIKASPVFMGGVTPILPLLLFP